VKYKRKIPRTIRFINNKGNPFLSQIKQGWTSALGNQFTHLLVTQVVVGPLSTQFSQSLGAILYSKEFIDREELWNYFKVQQVIVTVYPNNLNTSVEPCFMHMNWGNASQLNLRISDNVKVIPAYRTRFYTYIYKVPQVEEDGFNFSTYHPVDNAQLFPGSISFYSKDNPDSWNIRIDLFVKFKGARVKPEGSKVISTLEVNQIKNGTETKEKDEEEVLSIGREFSEIA
jgi:hypothetical protein